MKFYLNFPKDLDRSVNQWSWSHLFLLLPITAFYLYFYYIPLTISLPLSSVMMDSISSLRKPIRRKSFNPDSPQITPFSLGLFIKLLRRMCQTFCWALQHEFILGLLQSGFSPKYSEAPFVIKLTNALLNVKYLQKVFSRPPGYRPSLKHLDSPQGPSSPFVCGKFPCGAGRLSSYQRYKSLTEEETKSVLATSEFVFSYQISFVVP